MCAEDDGEDYRNNVFKVTADFERMAGTVSVHKMSGYGDDPCGDAVLLGYEPHSRQT